MTINPHPIEVTVYDTDSSLLEGAKAYVRNVTKGTTSSSEATTDENGVATIDLANLPIADGETLQYETGDVITIIAYNGTDSNTSSYTVTGNSYSISITLSEFTVTDPLGTIKTLLDNNWNEINSDSIVPTVSKIMDKKQISCADGDHVLLYEINENINPFGIGALEWEHLPNCSIDIRTTYKLSEMSDIRPHLMKMKQEVLRIMKANVSNPDTDYTLILPVRKKDLSDKSIGLGRMVIDVELRRYST